MREHSLKVWPHAFDAMEDGRKRFEWRKDDRDFAVGDVLHCVWFDPKTEYYNWDKEIRFRVTYILRGQFGVPDGYCVMGIEREPQDTSKTQGEEA